MYEKCAHCHLFIEANDDAVEYPEMGFAAFVHLHSGSVADEELDGSHDAAPSGVIMSLDDWRVQGPAPMLARFAA